VRLSPQTRLLLGAAIGFLLANPPSSSAQQPTLAKKPALGPAAPQSTHYPILLLAQGALASPVPGTTLAPTQASDPPWSLRIGQKGPERLDRAGYPPIPLEPGDVVREGTSESWTYHAKDSQTGAAISIRITRTACSDPASTARFVFAATIDHAQIGSMQGCARVAAELFPKIKNQSDDDDDDPEDKPPPPPTVSHFTPPTAVAYITATGKMLVKRGTVAHSVPGKPGYSRCLSHDGKKLLFTRDEQPSPLRTINEYDFTTGATRELIRANAYEAFWSPDDSRIAFLENVDGKWQVWSMPAEVPEKAAALYTGEVSSLYGWADAHTLLTSDLQSVSWIGDDGTLKQTLSSADLYGKDQFGLSSANTIRVHPLNPDLLLVSAELLPPHTAPSGKDAAPPTGGLFLYEIRSKRRTLLSTPDLTANFAEWSRDGLQIFFTGRPPSSNAMTIYKMFWDGTSQAKYQDGYGLVIGQ
jgi:uncharacterized membrane protein